MTAVQKRAIELVHLGYFDKRRPGRRYYPKWKQAYAIAKSEEHKKKKRK